MFALGADVEQQQTAIELLSANGKMNYRHIYRTIPKHIWIVQNLFEEHDALLKKISPQQSHDVLSGDHE
jgi:hypothetical protein